MQENNFKFRESFARLVKSMPEKQAGEFIKKVCGYAFEGKSLETKDKFLQGVFIYMQSAIDTERDNVKFGKIGGAMTAEQKKEQMHNGSVAGVMIALQRNPTGKGGKN